MKYQSRSENRIIRSRYAVLKGVDEWSDFTWLIELTLTWDDEIEVFCKMALSNDYSFGWHPEIQKIVINVWHGIVLFLELDRKSMYVLKLKEVWFHVVTLFWVWICYECLEICSFLCLHHFDINACRELWNNFARLASWVNTYTSKYATFANFSCIWRGYSAKDRMICNPNIA